MLNGETCFIVLKFHKMETNIWVELAKLAAAFLGGGGL